MKKIYTFALAILVSHQVLGQSTDNPAALINIPATDNHTGTVYTGGTTKMVCVTPVVTSASVCDSGSVQLSVTNGVSFIWENQGSIVSYDSSFNTPVLNTTTTYSVAGLCNPDSGMLTLPPHSSGYPGDIRGYFFTAPVNFTIRALRVPTDVTGDQTIEVLRFNAGAPPAYPTLTNSFTSLGYWNGVNTTSKIYTNIPVNAGDIIGVYGWRGTTNSYSSGGSFVASIAGNPVVLERTGMQANLNTSQMFDVWSEAGGSISRTELYYEIFGDTSIYVMSTVTVNQSAFTSNPTDLCNGDSIFAGGEYQFSAGTYFDTLSTTNGCDSIIETIVDLIPSPTVTADPVDTMCVNHPAASLNGIPAGGVWSGTGVNGNSFDPAVSGSGVFIAEYMFTDTNGCTGKDLVSIVVEACTGISDNVLEQKVKTYPNPASNLLYVDLSSLKGNTFLRVEDLSGKVLFENFNANGIQQLDLSKIAPATGIYLIRIENQGKMLVKKITRI